MDDFDVNGNFVVCSLFEEQDTTTKKYGILLYNKVEEGFQKLNRFRIERLCFKNDEEFPFQVGDIVVVASNGTVVNYNNSKKWLFKPEHILGKLNIGKRNA